jgi:hypothetical protein
MAWLRNIQQGYSMASSAQRYLEARAQERAKFRRELADLDPVGREAALAAVRWRKVIMWSLGGGALSLASFAAGLEAGLCLAAIVGTRVAWLMRKPAQERRKRELIEAFLPLLNEYRELLVRYPVDALSEDVRDGVGRRIACLVEFMHRLEVPRSEEHPEQVVAGHVFRPDGFYAWKPRRVHTLLTQVLPRDIFMEPHFVGLGFTPEQFRTYLDDVTQVVDDAYREAFEKQGNLVYGYVEPIPGVCELPAGTPVGLPLIDVHRFNHAVWFGKTGSGMSTQLVDLIIQDIAAGMGIIVLSPERDFFARLLRSYPAHRADDLIYLDFRTTSGAVVGFNVCALEPGEQLDLKAGELYSVLTRAMGPELGVTMKTLFQNAIYALLQTAGATLTDLYSLLSSGDRSFRTSVVRNPALDDKTREFWLGYDMSSYYQASFEPVVNRLAPLFRPPLSVVLSTPSWSVEQELNQHSRVVCRRVALAGHGAAGGGTARLRPVPAGFFRTRLPH